MVPHEVSYAVDLCPLKVAFAGEADRTASHGVGALCAWEVVLARMETRIVRCLQDSRVLTVLIADLHTILSHLTGRLVLSLNYCSMGL